MPTLDTQAILDRVYRHFVTDGKPPGILRGYIVYHQLDCQGHDRPCAIGIFDDKGQLDDSVFTNQLCPDVEDLFYEELTLLCEIFGVDRMTKEDMTFLQAIQAPRLWGVIHYHSPSQALTNPEVACMAGFHGVMLIDMDAPKYL